jgi:hypothetical protein
LKKSVIKKVAVTKAGKIEENKVNTEVAMQTIKNEIKQQQETLQERLKKRKQELAAKKILKQEEEEK